jgi:ATP-binding cassette, subfamily B, multidrug efflux pump
MITTFLKRKKASKAPGTGKPGAEEDEAPYKPIDLKMVGRLVTWMKPYRWGYATGITLGIVMIWVWMLGPMINQHIVDYCSAFYKGQPWDQQAGFFSRLTDRVTTWVTGSSIPSKPVYAQAVWHLVWVFVAWLTISGVALALDRWRILVMTWAGQRVQFDLRRAVFAHLQRLSMSFYDKNKLGRIISRCTSDISALESINVWGIDAIILNVMMIVIAAIALATLTDTRLFLSVCWLGPTFYIANRAFLRHSGKSWQVVREGFTRVSTNLAENITGIRVVTAFNRQLPNLDEFNRLQIDNTANNVRASRLQGSYLSFLGVLGFTGKAIILIYGGYLVLHRPDMTVGKIFAATMYWDWFMNPMRDLGNWYNNYMMAMASGERVLNLLDTNPDVADTSDARPLPRINVSVKFENVTFGYKPEVPVLSDINFEAKPGQVVALVGHTGSGKSSIISLIARFYQPQQGRILVDGHDIRNVTGESLHKQMGLVLQVNYLFTGTVMDNIRYVCPDATEAQIIEAATALGTHATIMSLKDGYQTFVGERGGNMSLGQRQLICFTRAYLADPRIFMLDEATSAVDTGTELLVQRSMEKLLEGRTTFIVAHRLSTIMRADIILVIDHGKIVERGTHRELIEQGGKYAHLYEQFSHGLSAGEPAAVAS